jgi:predicted transglutaminase-like cysteine proteinase
MSIFIRRARIFFLVAVCYGGTFAYAHPSRLYSVIGPRWDETPDVQLMPGNKTETPAPPKLASLAPNPTKHSEDNFRSSEPFGLPAIATPPGEIMSANWTELQSRIRADERTLAACNSSIHPCPQAARRFLSIVKLGRQHQGRARLGWINRAINLSISPMSDWAQYGVDDYWASPLQTLGSGAGDCEDYAILKYVVLHEMGIAADNLRLVIVQDKKRQAIHAIVAVRYEQKWLILDNRTMAMLNAEDASYYKPLFTFDRQDARAFETAAINGRKAQM